MKEVLDVSKVASSDIEEYLSTIDGIYNIINVEDVEEFRKKDVDLLIFFSVGRRKYCKSIEIKADRWYHTGNYFF